MKNSDLADVSKKDYPLQEPVAIIGIGCRYSDEIENIEDFWRVLIEKKSTLKDIPLDRFKNIDTLYDSGRGFRKIVSKRGGWLKNIQDFDAKFFKISPREAEKIDPHQRLMLEVSYEAFEDAGLKLEDIWGTKTGVYAGMWSSDFEHVLENSKDDIDVYSTTGSGRYAASGRIAYFFNLQGPTFTVDTACSSSLVAIHLACQSLHLHESDMSICAAANIIIDPFISIGYSRSRLLSDYGKCRFGAKDPGGYVRTEGVASVVLKRLKDAQRDGDFIYAVIPGSACNSDGQSNKHMLAPSAITQEVIIQDALSRAHIEPSQVQYVEAHGTGTKAGDPVEITSISNAVGKDRSQVDIFYTGSVKTNIGHTEAASGIAGLIKVILAMRNRKIPGNLYADEERNPHIPWESLALKLPSEAVDWPHPERTLIAGLNSFGISGSNAHLIIQEAPLRNNKENPLQRTLNILPLSALNEKALQSYCSSYLDLFNQSDSPSGVRNLVKNIAIRKADLPYRAAIVFENKEQILSGLQAIIQGEKLPYVLTGFEDDRKKTALIFPGQGGQWSGMGKTLYDTEPVFRDVLNELSDAIQKYSDWSLLDELFAADGMSEIDVIQPALMAVEIALAEWWKSLGVVFNGVVGHSMGEVGAAYMARAITLDEAALIICTRSQLMKSTAGKGAMAYIGVDENEVNLQIKQHQLPVEIAVKNSPDSCVVSGKPEAVNHLCSIFEAKDVFVKLVKVDVASHSIQMQPLLEVLKEKLTNLRPKNTAKEIFSTVETIEIQGGQLDAAYWAKNLRNTVRFAETIQNMIQNGYGHFIEVSPHPTLLQPIEENAHYLKQEVNGIGSLKREEASSRDLIYQVATYFAQGGRIHWRQFYDMDLERVQLPTYPWQRVKYWVEENQFSGSSILLDNTKAHPLLKYQIKMPQQSDVQIWESEINLKEYGFLKDHKINEDVVLPGAAFIEMLWTSARQLGGEGAHLIEDFQIKQALPLSEKESTYIQLTISHQIGNIYEAHIYSKKGDEAEEDWLEHVSAKIYGGAYDKDLLDKTSFLPFDPEKAPTDMTQVDKVHYEKLERINLPYGSAFQTVRDIEKIGNIIIADIAISDTLSNSAKNYFIHPTVLDGFIQSFLLEVYQSEDPLTYVPVSFAKVVLRDEQQNISGGQIQIKIIDFNQQQLVGDALVYNKKGVMILEIKGLTFTKLTPDEKELNTQILYEITSLKHQIPNKTSKRILLLAADDLPESFIRQLAPQFIVRKGEQYNQTKNEFTLDSSRPEQIETLISEIADQMDTIIHTWNIDEQAISGLPSQEESTLSVVRIAKACIRNEISPRLWVLTDLVEQFPAQSTALGLLHVLRNEHPELMPSSVQVADSNYEAAYPILISDTPENSWQIDAEQNITVERLSPIKQESMEGQKSFVAIDDAPFEVVMEQPGLLSELKFKRKTLTQVKDYEVVVAIRALGINFMNLMSALGIYPGKKNGFATLGIECVGVVQQVGKDVTHLKVGDRVMGMAYHTMASHVVVDASLMRKIPAQLSFIEAATIPVVFLTAYEGLIKKANLKKGERVLIHAATGGVGLAAIQVARLVGAEIYATAGSEEKRAYLKNLGIQGIYDSRSLDFYEQILRDTDGKGVDVVLNSVTGAAMYKSLELLSNFGRFVEIGKKDIYENARIGMTVFSKGLSYFMLDFEKMIFEKPHEVGDLLEELLVNFDQSLYQPLVSRSFPISKVKEAFEFMSTSKQIGKIVVEVDAENVRVEQNESLVCHADASYLITGGYGGLGLILAQHLIDKGAQRLILTGRSGQSENPLISEWKSSGMDIILAKADVSEMEDLDRVLIETMDENKPLAGIFHLAGILEDASILNLDENAYYRVISPKVLGAYNLHLLSQKYTLDYFVLFSSSTILFGSPGQAAYVAANNYMDALVQYRKRIGLPGLSVQWSTVSDVGLAASAQNRLERLQKEGVSPISTTELTDLLDRIAGMDKSVVGAFKFDIQKWQEAYPSEKQNHFYDLLRTEDVTHTQDEVGVKRSYRDILAEIQEPEERVIVLENQLKELVGQVVKLQAEDIHVKTTFKSLGIDSLMSIQLKNNLEKQYETPLSVTSLWTHATIRDYAGFLLEKMTLTSIVSDNKSVETKQEFEVEKSTIPKENDTEEIISTVESEKKEDKENIDSEEELTTDEIEQKDLSIDELSKLLDDELKNL